MKAEPKYDTVRDTWHPHLCPFGDECSGCDVDGYCQKARDAIPACLCCMCGTVSPASEWTYWKRDEEGKNWIPVEDGDYDPMELCPRCKWEHRDVDDGSGVYQGTTAEMNAQREADLPEYGEWWADRLEEVERVAA